MDTTITFDNWLRSPDAASSLQAIGANPNMFSQAPSQAQNPAMGGGMGMTGNQNGYSQYLKQLLNSNQQNPAFQKQVLEYYLESLSQNDDNEFNKAATLLSSDDPTAKQLGLQLLTGLYPDQFGGTAQTGYGAPQSYEDIKRQEALDLLKEPSGLSQRDFEWNQFLSQAPDEKISEYLQAKKDAWLFTGGGWKGTGRWNPFDASAWSIDRLAQAKMGYK